MSRWWTDLVAAISDVLPLPLLLLLSLVAAGIVGAAWYWFPAWVPRRLPTFGRPRWRLPRWRAWRLPRWRAWRLPRWLRLRWQWPAWRWPRLRLPRLRWSRRRRRTETPRPPQPPAGDSVPHLPADDLASLADRLAAQGRYAEAIRERLRAMVGQLVERGVVEHRPSWTATELAGAAGAALPVVAAPLSEAVAVFSDVWYGQRPAQAATDTRMRVLGESVRQGLQQRAVDRYPAWAVPGGRG